MFPYVQVVDVAVGFDSHATGYLGDVERGSPQNRTVTDTGDKRKRRLQWTSQPHCNEYNGM